MSTLNDGISLLKLAKLWYEANGPKLMDRRSESLSVFFETEKFDGPVMEDCAEMDNLTPSLIPLLAAVQAGFGTHFIAQVISHHNIDQAQLERVCYKSANTGCMYRNTSGEKLELVDVYIAAIKAQELLGRLPIPDFTDPLLVTAGMHSHSPDAWPATIVEKKAALQKSGRDPGYTKYTRFFSERMISRFDQLPNSSPDDFIQRSGMLSKVTYRKEIKLFNLWEELLIKAGTNPQDNLGLLVLQACKEASADVKVVIRNALINMHPHGLHNLFRNAPLTLYKTLQETVVGTDLSDVLDNLVLKINLSVPYAPHASNFNAILVPKSDFKDVLNNTDTLLQRACSEILGRDEDQVGFAHLAVFNTLQGMSLGPQSISGLDREAVILHLDRAMLSMVGMDDKPNRHREEMYKGFQTAFSLLGQDYQWDVHRLAGASSLGQKLLAQAGVNIRHFPNMSRKHRGEVLEDQLGL
jgi:hypothetical protein